MAIVKATNPRRAAAAAQDCSAAALASPPAAAESRPHSAARERARPCPSLRSACPTQHGKRVSALDRTGYGRARTRRRRATPGLLQRAGTASRQLAAARPRRCCARRTLGLAEPQSPLQVPLPSHAHLMQHARPLPLPRAPRPAALAGLLRDADAPPQRRLPPALGAACIALRVLPPALALAPLYISLARALAHSSQANTLQRAGRGGAGRARLPGGGS